MGFFKGSHDFTINDGKFIDVAQDYIENNNSTQTWNTNSNNRNIDKSVNSHNNSSKRTKNTNYGGVGTVNNQSGSGNTQNYAQSKQHATFPVRPQGAHGVRSMDAAAEHTLREGMAMLRREGRAGRGNESSDEDENQSHPSYPMPIEARQPPPQFPWANPTSQPTLQHSQSEPLPAKPPALKSNNPFAKLVGSTPQGHPEAETAPAQGEWWSQNK